MITYDYLIKRNIKQDETQDFVPDLIPTKLNNVVCIEGPNASGKSTLLNIIALGLFGTRSARINPILQNKMRSLLDLDHQKLKFSFEIMSKDNSLCLKADKNDLNGTEIMVQESIDGKDYKPLSFDNFEKQFNLIYDIPNNPTERLSELLKELREEQLQYGNRFKDFGFFLRSIITQITSSRDPKRLEEIKLKLEDALSRKTKVDEELPVLQNFLEALETSAYLQYYFYYANECERLSSERIAVKKKLDQFKKSGRKISTKLTSNKAKLSKLQNAFTETYTEVTPLIESSLPKKEKTRFKIWREINSYCPESDELSKALIEAVYFEDVFSCEITEMEKDNSFKNAHILERILGSLKEFEDSALMIPRLKVTFSEFIQILKDESNKSSFLLQKYKTLNYVVELLTEIKKTIGELQQKMKEVREEAVEKEEFSEKAVESFYGNKRQLEKIDEAIEIASAKRREYLQRCISKNIDERKLVQSSYMDLLREFPIDEKVNEYISLSEKQVLNEICRRQQELIDKRSEQKALAPFISMYEREKQRLEKQQPHRYEAYHEQLVELLKKIEAVSQKLLNEYNNDLKDLINNKIKESDIKIRESKDRFYKEVSRYLAHRIGSFRHIDKTYKAKIVDPISCVIIADDETIIHFADMGTGQSISAYLLSLLNVPASDKRMIIALFDEIAMMDDNSLGPIFFRMKQLYDENRLLFGILVQKSNELKIQALVG